MCVSHCGRPYAEPSATLNLTQASPSPQPPCMLIGSQQHPQGHVYQPLPRSSQTHALSCRIWPTTCATCAASTTPPGGIGALSTARAQSRRRRACTPSWFRRCGASLPDPLHLQKKNRVLLDSATELAERTRSICRGSHVVTLQTVSTIEVLTVSAERTAGGH